jgi:hypothetical protein
MRKRKKEYLTAMAAWAEARNRLLAEGTFSPEYCDYVQEYIMSASSTLDYQINRAAFWSAVAGVGTLVPSAFFPLDAPGGYNAEHADRVAWLAANSGAFITAWVVQIVSMLALSGVFAGVAWQISGKHPLRAIVAATVTLISIVVFIIPKFMAVWTMPLLAKAVSTGAVGSDMAQQLLPILNVSMPFSLFTSFDYLGFWLYAVFALLVARPLLQFPLSAKIAGFALGAFGILYHGVVIAVLTGAIGQADIETYAMSVAGLLLIVVIAMGIYFRGAMASKS